jgi:O-succinylbenzoic acid--CoA ligase
MRPDLLQGAWAAGRIVPLATAQQRAELAVALGPGDRRGVLEPLQRQWGPGVLVGSGGSSGGRRWCLQPLSHLQASAAATGRWLEGVEIDPAACLHLNPMPLHHVSGLLPLVRARQWACGHLPIAPVLLRDPEALAAALPVPSDRPTLISLVPTQLQRLMAAPAGLAWLRQLAVIWVGGAPLPQVAAARARAEGLRLAPCYGATETAAMVCALAPERFLAGAAGCGLQLADVELRFEPDTGAIAVRTARLSPGWLERGELRPLPGCEPGASGRQGWWRSGDGGRLTPEGLLVLGRLDGALHSGGETVFPEVLEERLLAAAQVAGLPLEAVLLLPEDDPEWGQRLVALVRPAPAPTGAQESLLASLAALTRPWLPAERPRRWLLCPELACSAHGKWQRGHWRGWLTSLEAGRSITGPNDHPQ